MEFRGRGSGDRLVAVQQGVAAVVTYLHEAQGQRVAKTAGGAVTHYLYDLSGSLIAEADGGTGAAGAEYVWLAGMPLAFIQDGSSRETRFRVMGAAVGCLPQRDAEKAQRVAEAVESSGSEGLHGEGDMEIRGMRGYSAISPNIPISPHLPKIPRSPES